MHNLHSAVRQDMPCHAEDWTEGRVREVSPVRVSKGNGLHPFRDGVKACENPKISSRKLGNVQISCTSWRVTALADRSAQTTRGKLQDRCCQWLLDVGRGGWGASGRVSFVMHSPAVLSGVTLQLLPTASK